MRTTKRFTPALLARFEKQGRGTGTYEDYIGWHRVTRGDPASCGRSHLLNWRGRLIDLLSDGELGEQLFATMLPDLDDSLEQHKLTPEDSPHPLLAYGAPVSDELFPGTLRLAVELGIRHPKVRDKDQSDDWVMTTDLVLVFNRPCKGRTLLPLAFKPKGWDKSRRAKQLLRLEREYWLRRGAPWLLITPELYDDRVFKTLRRIACWTIVDPASPELRRLARDIAIANTFASVTQLLELIERRCSSMYMAQCALWQAVWYGDLPIRLTRGWRPHLPLEHISPEEFALQNPIASRRSSWT
jgi:hypothetical protein